MRAYKNFLYALIYIKLYLTTISKQRDLHPLQP